MVKEIGQGTETGRLELFGKETMTGNQGEEEDRDGVMKREVDLWRSPGTKGELGEGVGGHVGQSAEQGRLKAKDAEQSM